jgi:hypothetical protein
MRKELNLQFDISAQPNETTCGPTCLHALYNYYGEQVALGEVITGVKRLETGGTLAVMLGNHALQRGYKATIYTYNLHVFDPTWFIHPSPKIIGFLEEQMRFKSNKQKLQVASAAYINFLSAGGEIRYAELDQSLIKGFLANGVPILTGLSATYLYSTPREIPQFDIYDSIKGEPSGHFVVINGYDDEANSVMVADPLEPNPLGKGQVYSVDFVRLINSIMLGIVTYDANLLIIEPPTTK